MGNYWCLNGGTYIASNTNLDDIKAIGSYFNHNDVESKTIINNPVDTAFTLQIYASNGEASYYVTQELRSIYIDGGIFIRKFDRYTNKWTDWDKLIQKSDLYSLHTPIEGTVVTNKVPSKVDTTVNSLTLSAGIYIIIANATYDSSFSGYLTNYYILQDGKYLATCRNTGDAGSGQCPSFIIKSTSQTVVNFILYQGSSEIRTLSRNSLIATRLA
jgi:hypothetical protein